MTYDVERKSDRLAKAVRTFLSKLPAGEMAALYPAGLAEVSMAVAALEDSLARHCRHCEGCGAVLDDCCADYDEGGLWCLDCHDANEEWSCEQARRADVQARDHAAERTQQEAALMTADDDHGCGEYPF